MNLLFIKYSLFFLFFLVNLSIAQTDYSLYINSINNSVGKTAITECSYLQNPAQFKYADETIISFSISPSKFGINDLTPFLAMACNRFSDKITAGTSFFSIGNKLWNEFSFSAFSAYQFGDKISIAADVQYSRIHIQNYSEENLLFVNVGSVIDISSELSAGFYLSNFLRSNYSLSENNIPQYGIFGVGYEPIENLTFDLDAIIRINEKSGFNFAGSYNFENIVKARLAYQSNPSAIEFAASSFLWDWIRVYVGIYHHNTLGIAQNFSVSVFL